MTGPAGGDAARRVRVTHPRMDAPRPLRSPEPYREIHDQTRIGALYTASLLRSQRRLAAGVVLTLALMLAGIALLGALAPEFVRARCFGIPLAWLILGVGVYPLLVALAIFTARHADRNERAFADLVRHR